MFKLGAKFFYLVVFAGLVGMSAVQAEESDERKKVLNRINKIISDRTALNMAMKKGQERTRFCSNCHGEDGNSKRPEIPNLAGQNPAYLLEQFQNFQTGVRKNMVMQALAKNTMTSEDKINISIYFSNQKLKPINVDASNASEGERIFQGVCLRCHGADGRGEEGYARVAGQQPVYVVNTLKRFRANATNSGNSKRSNALMEQVSARLSDEEIDALAVYISQL